MKVRIANLSLQMMELALAIRLQKERGPAKAVQALNSVSQASVWEVKTRLSVQVHARHRRIALAEWLVPIPALGSCAIPQARRSSVSGMESLVKQTGSALH